MITFVFQRMEGYLQWDRSIQRHHMVLLLMVLMSDKRMEEVKDRELLYAMQNTNGQRKPL
jgi:hypothetical protein